MKVACGVVLARMSMPALVLMGFGLFRGLPSDDAAAGNAAGKFEK